MSLTYNQMRSSIKTLSQSLNLQVKATGKKEEIIRKYKGLASIQKIKQQSAGQKIKNAYKNFQSKKPLIAKQGVRIFADRGGRIYSRPYTFQNTANITKANVKKYFNQYRNTNSIFLVAVITPEGHTSARSYKFKQLMDIVDNDFKVTQEISGSDMQGESEYEIDFTRAFRVNELKTKKSKILAHCNRQQNRIHTVGNCQVMDVYTKKSNCGFQVLKALKMKTDVKPKDQKGLSVEDMVLLCETYDFPIRIVDIENNELYKNEKFTEHKTIVISHGENHWYIFVQEVMSKEEKRKEKQKRKIENAKKKKEDKEKITILVLYDIESVFNSELNNMAQSYSVAYLPLVDINLRQITEKTLSQYKKSTNVKWGVDCCKQMVDQLLTDHCPSKYTFKFISFNGSCFDDYFLMDQALNEGADGEWVDATFSNKSIVGLKFQYGKCWDLRKFLTIGSLKNLCGEKQFNTFPKKMEGFDHRLPQKAFDEGKLDEWIEENKQKIIDYNKFDVMALYSLTIKFRDAVKQLTGSDVFDHDTIGQHAYSLCKRRWKFDGIQMKRPESELLDKFIRSCLTAGRTQVMASKDGKIVVIKGEKFAMVDVVSLYPFVMMCMNNWYPCGTQTNVTVRDRSKLGFYKIRLQQREDLPNVLPKRVEGDPLDWNCKEEFESGSTSVDLDTLEEFGHKFEILEGVEFSDRISGDKLFACQEVFKSEKIRQDVYKDYKVKEEVIVGGKKVLQDKYNVALREVCKLYLNSLSGKVIQRNFDTVTKITKSAYEIDKFIGSCVEDSAYCHIANEKYQVLNGVKMNPYGGGAKPSYLGVFIYAHARRLMYTKIFTKIETLYTDTDSALVKYEDFLVFKQQNPELFQKVDMEVDGKKYKIKEFGTLDSELSAYNDKGEWVGCDECTLIAPKNYLVCNRKLNYYPKLKCKGVSFGGESCCIHRSGEQTLFDIASYPHYVDLFGGECIGCDQGFCSYNDDLPLYRDKTRLFDELVEKQKCEVKCRQITVKTFTNHRNTQVGVYYRQINKTITAKSLVVQF